MVAMNLRAAMDALGGVATRAGLDADQARVEGEQLAAADFDATLDELLDEMKGMTADDLQDGVHRRFEYRLCPACHRRFLANPLGKPRGDVRAGKN